MNDINDGIVLLARVFLVALFLLFGWRKLRDYRGTVSQMARDHLPMPALVALVAMLMELPVSFAIAVGMFTRPLALLMTSYTFGTSLSEHRYWAMSGPTKVEAMESFYKNLCIMGGFLLLFVTGAGKYSIDSLSHMATP